MYRNSRAGSFNESGLGSRGGGLSMGGGMRGGTSEDMGGDTAGVPDFRQRHDLIRAMLESISASTSGFGRRRISRGMSGVGRSEGLDPIVAQGIALCDPMQMMDLQRGARGLLGAIDMGPRAFARRLQRVHGVGNIRIVRALAGHCRKILGMGMCGDTHMEDMMTGSMGAHIAGSGGMSPYTRFSRGNAGGMVHPRSQNPFTRAGSLPSHSPGRGLMHGRSPFGDLEGNPYGGWQGGRNQGRPGGLGRFWT